jgi:hypothetical protein
MWWRGLARVEAPCCGRLELRVRSAHLGLGGPAKLGRVLQGGGVAPAGPAVGHHGGASGLPGGGGGMDPTFHPADLANNGGGPRVPLVRGW